MWGNCDKDIYIFSHCDMEDLNQDLYPLSQDRIETKSPILHLRIMAHLDQDLYILPQESIRTKPPILHLLAIPITPPINQSLLTATRRHPLARLPRLHLANIHRVNLLQRPSLRLAHEEIHNQDSREIAPRKHISVLEPDIANDEIREERNQKIPRPIRRRDESHAARAVVRREKLADDAPDNGAPGGGVEGDEEAGEDDHGLAGGGRVGGGGVVEGKGADGGEDEEAGRHADAADDEGAAAAEPLHDVEAEKGHAEVDAAEDHGCHEAVVDTRGRENLRPVVEEKIRSYDVLLVEFASQMFSKNLHL